MNSLAAREIDIHDFLRHLQNIISIPGVEDMIQQLVMRHFVGNISIRDICRNILPIDYHFPNEVQDVLLQSFADIDFCRILDQRADDFRRSNRAV